MDGNGGQAREGKWSWDGWGTPGGGKLTGQVPAPLSSLPAGALLGLKGDSQLPACQEDKEVPGLFHATPLRAPLPPGAVAEAYLLSKQGKSCRYQLWNYQQVQESNAQLTDFSPRRAADGKVYVVPAGGVQEGLCGKAVLLHPLPAPEPSETT